MDKHINTINETGNTTIITMEEVAYTISEFLEFACTTEKDLKKAITTGMMQLKQIKTVAKL